MKLTKQLNVYVPPATKAALDDHAHGMKLSISAVVANILAAALKPVNDADLLHSSPEEKKTLRRVLAFLRGTKPDEEIREQFDLLLRLFERRA